MFGPNQIRLKVFRFSLGTVLLISTLFSCSEGEDTLSSVVSQIEGSGQIKHLDFDGNQGILNYTHDIGSTPQDVYFVFTNTNLYDSYGTTSVSSQTLSTGDLDEINRAQQNQINRAISGVTQAPPRGLRDRPELLNLETPVIHLSPEQERNLQLSATPLPLFDTVGATNSFKNFDFETQTIEPIPATLQHQITDPSADMTLNLWVANQDWGGCSYCMNIAMLTAFGNKFLNSDPSGDIYDWVTNLYGLPWGDHNNSAYISGTAAQQIDILFYDINDDNSPDGGVLGYFWSKDNAKYDANDNTNYTNVSNERLMFYMDSVMAANPMGGSSDTVWSISDDWPAEILSTLAHEFQHMIHFYQKSLIRADSSSQTWLNEMCSMVAEDLIADKMQTDGPRGVAYDNPTAGTADNHDGRLRWFNKQNYRGLLDWYSGNDVLYSYGTSYAFGAYLSRNYDGAALFKNIVQNAYTDERAVTSALTSRGYNLSFATLLKRWGAAALLSDTTSDTLGYVYNSSGALTSTQGATDYHLGAINLFNFSPAPNIPISANPSASFLYKTANRYYQVGSNLTGSHNWTIEMPPGVTLTVVTKDSS